MLLGVIADDFTGGSDVANALVNGAAGEGGLKVAQYFGLPQQRAAPDIEAGVISLKFRSIPAGEAVAEAMAALAWLRQQGCRQILYKYCSTFDSTPEGNIGPVGEALAAALGARGVVACPVFPRAGRTLFNGHLFVNGRLLNESGMQNHPLNPMTDPDLRRWLALQCQAPVGLVPQATVTEGPEAISSALAAAADRGEVLVIADAISDADLLALGAALADAPLLTGGSGIAIGLPRNFIRRGLATGGVAAAQSVPGPAAILAGSCSGATRSQIKVHARSQPTLNIDADAVMAGTMTPADAAAFVAGHRAGEPLVYSSAAPEAVADIQRRYGAHAVASRLEAFFAELAQLLVAAGVRRLVVAGGETSGAVAVALALPAVRIGPEVDPGVPLLYAEDRPLALALKSGNFGGPDFFSKALAMMES
jgi:uncharacterized protein YgbK (DUF1537 family)